MASEGAEGEEKPSLKTLHETDCALATGRHRAVKTVAAALVA
jgi:hypothetical protein